METPYSKALEFTLGYFLNGVKMGFLVPCFPVPRRSHHDLAHRPRLIDSFASNCGRSLPIVHEVLHSPGEPLDHEARRYFEPRFGHDFSKVRVHSDEKQRNRHAKGNTCGSRTREKPEYRLHSRIHAKTWWLASPLRSGRLSYLLRAFSPQR